MEIEIKPQRTEKKQNMKMIARFLRTKIRPMPFCLAVGCMSMTTTALADGTNAAPPGPDVTGRHKNENFWKRFEDANFEALSTPSNPETPPPAPGAPTPAPTRRGLPAPFDSPPYPNGEWQIGGTEIIGSQNLTPDSPLMQALYDGPHGQAWRDSKIKFYGWEDFSANASTSHNTTANPGVPGVSPSVNGNNGTSGVTGDGANFPEVYDQLPNTLSQNQFVLYAERVPDEFQTDHCDWGFRMSWVYGLDYRYMISRGWDDEQLTHRNNFEGMDDPMMYVNLYIPKVCDGLNLTLGRIISEADIEAQLAPNNLMSSHSLLYGYDPYCQWGLFATLKLNDNWTIQLGPSAGNDVTPWETQDPGTQPTFSAMFQYTSSNNKFGFYGGGNAINNAHWGFNNIQQYVGTFTYKFNEKWWTSHETWFMYQCDCPGQTGSGPGGKLPTLAPDEPLSQNGGFGYTDAAIPVHPGWAAEWATLNYTMYRIWPNLFVTVRNELFNDMDGQRTGYATLYSEHSIGLTWWPCSIITFRPELRFDHSYGTHGSPEDPVQESKPFDNGTRSSQFTAQFDVIYHF
jgi:hypothetical protein